MILRIATVILLLPTIAVAQQASTQSMDLQNSPSARVKSSVTITANVTNRSRTAAPDGTVVIDNAYASCTPTFGNIH